MFTLANAMTTMMMMNISL